MKITWYGHAAFIITTEKGTSIIIDPYEPGAFGGALSYGRIQDRADVVITSHDHADHNYIRDIKGEYDLIDKAGAYEVKEVKIEMIPAFHDPSGGKERGRNLISVLRAEGLTLVHLGDLGHPLNGDVLKTMGKVDVLLLPVGGYFTIDAGMGTNVMDAIKPAITIPMHYKTDKCSFPIAPVGEFTRGKRNVRVLRDSSLEVKVENLPGEPEIIVLMHAL